MAVDQESREPGWTSRITLGLLAALVALLFLELLSHLAIGLYNGLVTEPIRTRSQLVDRHLAGIRTLLGQSERREVLHPIYGWSYRAGFAEGPDTINERGLRASRRYAPPVPGQIRIAAFGDSFVYCNEVANAACWTSQIEQSWNAVVLNYGVGGFGTDQAFLRYVTEGQRLEPEIVLIGFAPVDLRRIVNRYRGFIEESEGPWFKPRFVLDRDGLRLIPTPVGTAEEARRLLDDPSTFSKVGQNDHWYRRAVYEHPPYQWSATYRLVSQSWTKVHRRVFDADRLYDSGGLFRPEAEAFKLQRAVLEAFVDSVAAAKAQAVVLILPGKADVTRYLHGEVSSYAPLVDSLEKKLITVFDPIAVLSSSARTDSLFAPDGHYSMYGNSIIASEVAEFLGLTRR